MNSKAIQKYFWDINVFNIPFSLMVGLMSGFIWSPVIFSSFGLLIGFLGYQIFKKNEYYTYYNLGFTKVKLFIKVWLLNLGISSLVLSVYILFR